MKKILVVTITWNRLEMTKEYLGTLKKKAGCLYRHIVIDNGSTDGTVEWLKENGYEVIQNPSNDGIIKAWLSAVRYAEETGFIPDYVMKFDNDCDVKTDDILAKILAFYEANGDYYIVSPVDLNILADYLPQMVSNQNSIGKHEVRITTHTGGMFTVVPYEAFCKMREQNGGQGIAKDQKRGEFWRSHGFQNVYIKGLEVWHQGLPENQKDYKF